MEDRHTEGEQTEEWRNRKMNMRTDRHESIQTKRIINRQDGKKEEWTDRRTDRQKDGQKSDKQVNGQTDEQTEGWLNRKTEKQIDQKTYKRMALQRSFGCFNCECNHNSLN